MGKYVDWASILFAAISALLWLRASLAVVKVPDVEPSYQNAPLVHVKRDGTKIDILATAQRQTLLNAYAAGWASLAAASAVLKGFF